MCLPSPPQSQLGKEPEAMNGKWQELPHVEDMDWQFNGKVLGFRTLLPTRGIIPYHLRNISLLICSAMLSRKYMAKEYQKCI